MSLPDSGQFEEAEDERLLAALRAGDPRSFVWLVRAHGGRMLAVARGFLRDEEEARDAVQNAFLSAFQALGTFSGQSKLSTWLHRIVVNAALMRLRSRRRRREESIEGMLPRFKDDGHHVDAMVEWRERGDDEIDRQERCALVRRCIERLPESYRTVLLLRDIEELDTEETARLLGVTENAVKVRLHRARQALRTLLDPHFRGGSVR